MINSSVQLGGSVVSDSTQPHGLQHTKLPCLSPIPRACSNSCPFELVMPSNSLILSSPLFPPSNFFSISVFSNKSVLHIRKPKYWSFGFSISPSNECSRLSKGLSRVFSNTTVQKHQFFGSHPYMTTGKTVALNRWVFVSKVCKQKRWVFVFAF